MSFKRSIFSTFLAQAPTLLLYFVASTLITRLLGDVGRGEYTLLTSQVALLAMIMGLNLGFGITYFTAQATKPEPDVLGAAATMILLDLATLPLILWGISSSDQLTDLFMPSGRTQLGYWGFVLGSIILSRVNTFVSAILLGLKRFKEINWMGVLNASLSAIAFIFLYLQRGRLPSSDALPVVLAVSLAAMALQSSIWVMLYVKHVRLPPIPVWGWAKLKPMLSFSLVVHLSNLINLVNYRFDVWVVGQYKGTAALGLYSVAVGVVQLLFYIPEPFSRVVQPYLFGQVKDEMLSRFKSVARLNFTVVLVLALAIGALAQWAVPLLFGNVFSASVFAIYLLLPGILFSSTTKLLTPLVVHGGLQRFSLYATTLAAVITIALDLALIPGLGIEGAAITTTAAYLVTLLIILYTIHYRMGIQVHDLFLVRWPDLQLMMRKARPTDAPGPGVEPAGRTVNGGEGRILCVVGWWPTGKDVAGVFIKEHLKAIAAHRPMEVLYLEVLKGQRPWPITEITTALEDGLNVHRARIRTPVRRFDLAERLVRGVYSRLVTEWHKQSPFSLVHVHVRTEVTSQVLPIASKLNLPVLLTEHNSFYHLGIRALMPAEEAKQRRSIHRWLANPAIKAVMPVSEDLAKVLRSDFGVPRDKITVVPNIASAVFRPGPPPLPMPFRIVLAAVWRPPKGHNVFINALGLLPPELLGHCRVDWVGYGPEYARIRQRCRGELPQVDIRFPGYLDKPEMARMMQAAHLFVLPTVADNLPCVVLESLCCGTPVVSMTVNGVPELVDHTNGLLVPPADPAALAVALATCIRQPGLFDRAAIARDALPKYSPEAVGAKILSVYRKFEKATP